MRSIARVAERPIFRGTEGTGQRPVSALGTFFFTALGHPWPPQYLHILCVVLTFFCTTGIPFGQVLKRKYSAYRPFLCIHALRMKARAKFSGGRNLNFKKTIHYSRKAEPIRKRSKDHHAKNELG